MDNSSNKTDKKQVINTYLVAAQTVEWDKVLSATRQLKKKYRGSQSFMQEVYKSTVLEIQELENQINRTLKTGSRDVVENKAVRQASVNFGMLLGTIFFLN